ncbi:Putative RNA-binding protein Luc7-like 1 [Tupaia chinensis]|uniref:Putative RNA-binding protein Luc7-like 1 n=1 Tax=Tupaia chinensis TaxID=246437 RepID=L9KXS4_TUPCH|nr:Putative RNA-binding protein Luc7-like 1 [Tupaia chinensis]
MKAPGPAAGTTAGAARAVPQEEYRNSMPASSFQQQKLRVCEVCSAYLGLHDNDRRLADHFGGKLHLGFIQIREKLRQLRKTVAEKQEKRNQDRLRRREEREREERLSRRSRSRDRRRRRSRSASRERRKPSRSRSRDRQRRPRSRSRSHSRGHRRASRDRSARHKFSRERASREEPWESGRSERGPAGWRLGSANGPGGSAATGAGACRLEARELQRAGGFAAIRGEGGRRALKLCGTVNSLTGVPNSPQVLYTRWVPLPFCS